MTNANYVRHVKVLGKFCKLWDDASASVTSLQLLLVRTYDQMATGENPSLPVLIDQSPNFNKLNNSITAGPVQTKATVVEMTSTYLISSDFRDDFVTTTITTPSNATSVLVALVAEMGIDSETFTDESATGFVNFFETNYPDIYAEAGGTFPQNADVSATLKDSVYVVDAIV